ncbi:NAD-dependent epimerase/dehydratase family protein [Rubrivirga sp. IMCC43871]|uniref:NAD-dependent epimerase/dehydratase family protein n=1 Tax=Rubrivirga sp. IMCC43871 TaxID=3391575 RepID=UPI0039900733
MHVLLTGATGFVGGHVLAALRDRGHTVRALVRGDGAGLPDDVETEQGDVTDAASLAGAFDGVDAVVHLVGIIDEKPSKGVTFQRIHVGGTRRVVEAAQAAGVTRFVHMSANGARPDGNSAYQRTKWAAEEIVRRADFAHTVIFRPSTLFGDPGPDDPEFAKRLWETLVRPFPVLPVFGKGDYELQPVHVAACADAMAQAVDRDASAGVSYCVAGPERIPYREVLARIARGGGIAPKPTAPVPIGLARIGVYTLGRAGLLPISPAQFEMLIEGNTCDPSAFFADFGVETPRFDADSLAYLRQY